MRHPIHKVTWVKVLDIYTLEVGFSDGLVRRIDLESILNGPLYGPLRDRCLFQRAAVDPETGTLVWPNGVDFDPTVLHDWDEYRQDFEKMTLHQQVCAEDRSPYESGKE